MVTRHLIGVYIDRYSQIVQFLDMGFDSRSIKFEVQFKTKHAASEYYRLIHGTLDLIYADTAGQFSDSAYWLE